MKTDVRFLSERGIQLFKEYLSALASGAKDTPPVHLLDDAKASMSTKGCGTVERREFSSKLELASYLHDVVTLDRDEIDHNVGLWSWLALFYFDDLCPAAKDGSRKPGESYRYILSADYRHYYRHLLAGPYTVFRLHRDTPHQARAILNGPVDTHGDFSEQLASRMELITNRGLIEAVDLLYFDPKNGAPKRGATNRKRRGTLRRLVALVWQLDLTYDLYGMKTSEILSLLPDEFASWKPGTA